MTRLHMTSAYFGWFQDGPVGPRGCVQNPRCSPAENEAEDTAALIAALDAGRSRSCPAARSGERGNPVDPDASRQQTLQGSFSAVSKRNFAIKYAFESSRRDLRNALLCTAL